MENDKPYTNPNLRITDLAAMVDCTPTKLSQMFNQHLRQNFFDYVNLYRVEEFKRRVASEKYSQYTVVAISETCGFKRSTFFATFKSSSTAPRLSIYSSTEQDIRLKARQIRPRQMRPRRIDKMSKGSRHGRNSSTPGRYKTPLHGFSRLYRPANPYCQATTVTFTGNLVRGGIRVRRNLSLPPRPDLLSRNNAPANRNPTWREAEQSPSPPSHPRCREKQILPAPLRERIRKADVQFLHHALVTVVTVVTGQQAHIRHTPRITQSHTVEIDHECRVVQLLHRTADAGDDGTAFHTGRRYRRTKAVREDGFQAERHAIGFRTEGHIDLNMRPGDCKVPTAPPVSPPDTAFLSLSPGHNALPLSQPSHGRSTRKHRARHLYTSRKVRASPAGLHGMPAFCQPSVLWAYFPQSHGTVLRHRIGQTCLQGLLHKQGDIFRRTVRHVKWPRPSQRKEMQLSRVHHTECQCRIHPSLPPFIFPSTIRPGIPSMLRVRPHSRFSRP